MNRSVESIGLPKYLGQTSVGRVGELAAVHVGGAEFRDSPHLGTRLVFGAMALHLQSARFRSSGGRSSLRLVAVLSAVAALVIALSLVMLFETPIERHPVPDTAVEFGSAKSNAQLRTNPENAGAVAGSGTSSEIRQQIAEALRKAETEFKTMERGQSEFIGTAGAEGSAGVHYLIRQPTQEEYAKYVAVLSRSMEGLSKEASRSAYDRQVKLLQQYTSFSSPFKVVQRWRREIVNPDGTPGIRESSSETFVASRNNYELTPNGIKIWGAGGDGSGASRNFVGDEKDRYRHIFERQ